MIETEWENGRVTVSFIRPSSRRGPSIHPLMGAQVADESDLRMELSGTLGAGDGGL